MFAKKNRYLFKGALPKQSVNFPFFSVRYSKNSGELKVAVVVSKKVDTLATARNKIKRRILSLIQKNISQNEPFSLIFYVKKGILDSKNIESDVKALVEKIK